MKTVIRFDREPLRKPTTTPQGFVRYDGHVARAGIYEYKIDGKPQLELKPIEELASPATLASYDAASVTIEHPPKDELVTADNVRRHEVGTVTGAARMDGDYVSASFVVKDSRALKLVKGGKQELSPGQRLELDETPGHDLRYATAKNPTGRYDAIQRNIRVNHLAICEHARGGSTIRLRADAAERVDGEGKLTTAVAGHQHLINLCDYDGQSRSSGSTSDAMSEGADVCHDHPWTRGTDGKITIGQAAGHTHAVLDDAPLVEAPAADRYDANSNHDAKGRFAVGKSADAEYATAHAYAASAADHHAANLVAASAHQDAAKAHRAAGNHPAAAEHAHLADSHISAASSPTKLRIRPSPMTSAGTHEKPPPAPSAPRPPPPKISAAAEKATQAAKAASDLAGVAGFHARNGSQANVDKARALFAKEADAHERAAAEHRRSGEPGAADYHSRIAADSRAKAAGGDLNSYRGDGHFDRISGESDRHGMDPQEQIRSLKEQLAAAEAKLSPATTAATQHATRADAAEATICTLQGEITELRAQIAAAAQVVETEAIKREKIRADSAEEALRMETETRGPAIEARVALERQAAVVMPELNMRGLGDRAIIATVVKRLDAQQDISSSVSDAYLRGRFDSLLSLHSRNARSLQRVADVITAQVTDRADSIEEKRRQMRNQGTEPLPNSREAQAARAQGRA